MIRNSNKPHLVQTMTRTTLAIKATVSAPKTQTLKLACVTRGHHKRFKDM
jgi:hypothetical protein